MFGGIVCYPRPINEVYEKSLFAGLESGFFKQLEQDYVMLMMAFVGLTLKNKKKMTENA